MHYIIYGTGLFSIISTALALSGSKMWLADLSTHLIPQHVFVQLLFLVYLFYKKRSITSTGGLLLIICTVAALTGNYRAISPLYRKQHEVKIQSVDENCKSSDFSFTVLNLWSSNPYPQKVADYLKNQNPDILILVEVTPQWEKALTGLGSIYKNQVVTVREDNFGLAVYSKFPILSSKIYETDEEKRPIIYCRVQLGDLSEMDVLAIHPTPPKHPRYFNLRTKYFKRVTEIINILNDKPPASHKPMVVGGDFNCPHWSPFFKTLLQETSLLDTGAGLGFSPTWPTYLPFLLGPIDHCITSKGIKVLARGTGPFLWSDHFPLELHMTISKNQPVEYAEKSESKR